MRIEPLTTMPPKMERPIATGAADLASVDRQLLSNDPEIPVTAVQEAAKAAPVAGNGRGETVWLEKERREVFRIIDPESGEVITQVPSDQVLNVSKSISELLEDDSPKQVNVKS
jgi:hypothetical protein